MVAERSSRSRGIGAPRGARVVVNTTVELRWRLERIAEVEGWSLSKTAHLVLAEGLKVWEEKHGDDISLTA